MTSGFARPAARLSFSLALSLAGAGVALAQADKPAVPAEGEVGCAVPVKAGESATDLSRRFGAEASIEDVDGAEGEKVKALVLYPKDNSRRIEVSFDDEAMTEATGLSWSGAGNKWTIAGVAVGNDVKAVRAAHGAPFSISGFGWDYGGYASGFENGRLGKLPGGCTISLRFDNAAKSAPAELSGDGVQISSDDPKLAAFAPVVTEIAIAFH